MSFTPSQRKALSSNRHLAIIANAGSGKTRVLVERYVELFLRHPDLCTRNVVAITFTENAAAELRSRISREIKTRLEAVDPASTDARRLRYLRDSLPSAFIGTIHGFASRILKAYPVEANIDAGFTIVQGAERTILEEDALYSSFYSALDAAYATTSESDVLRLFRRQGRKELAELVRVLLRNRSRARRVRERLLDVTDEAALAIWRERVEHELRPVLDPGFALQLLELSRHVKTKKNGAPGKYALELQEAVNAFAGTVGFFERAAALKLVAKKFITDEGEPSANVFNFADRPPEAEELARSMIEQIVPVRALLKVCPSSEEEFQEQHLDYLEQMRGTFRLYDLVLEEYTRAKLEFGLLDFDDLIEHLERLLENQPLREELSREFRFIMVDEYQDTDESQLALVRQLTEDFGRRGNLAIVGDPKQAIYTFRNADVEIFFQTIEAIRAQELGERSREDTLELSEAEQRGVLSLAESFRMRREPLAIINRIFGSAMDGTESTVNYSPLVHGRASAEAGRVEWICPRPPEPEGAVPDAEMGESEIVEAAPDGSAEEEVSEVELVALKIRSILSDPNYVVEEEGQPRPAAPEDIAILVRSRTYLSLLEGALRNAGVPYAVAKGTGYFEQPEVLDILSYLSFLTNPANDTALAATLRAPFFALSDTELFQVAKHRVGYARGSSTTFWDRFQSYSQETGHAHLERAFQQLRDNLSLAGRTGCTFLIEKIYSETGIYATFHGAPQAAQMMANLDKFLALARASDASGFSGLLDFVERIEYLKKAQERESQAELPDERGLVRIMTVHEAKGLEFPIVILPFLQKKFKLDSTHILDKELGIQIKPREGEEPVIVSRLIRSRAERATIEEEKRIFYVATTRARDHLILSCTLANKIEEHSWLAWTCEALGFPLEAESIRFQETILEYDGETRLTEARSIDVTIPLIRDDSDIIFYEERSREVVSKASEPLYLEPIHARESVSQFSATQLLRYRECPTQYYLANVLGMPEEPTLDSDLEPAEDSERIKGRLLGQVVHEVLARWEVILSNGALNANALENQLARSLDDLGIRDSLDRIKYGSAVEAHLQTFLHSPLQGLLRTATDVKREFPLRATMLSGDQLYGILDCLIREENGALTILDYKTDTLTSGVQRQKKLERYEFQMRVYASLLRRYEPNATSIRAILFFTESGESFEFNFDTNDFERFDAETAELIESIRAEEKVPVLDALPRNEEHCPECRFYESSQCIVLAASQNPIEIPAI